MEEAIFTTPLGSLKLSGNLEGLSAVQFLDNLEPESPIIPEVLLEAVLQLKEYFSKKRKEFELPLHPEGTTFQKKVWQQLATIPFGSTKSYAQMANELGDPKVIRAAASANGKNPIPIIIPCHRVIGTNGSLTGYAGGLQRKKWLLAHESEFIQGELF